MKKTVAIIGAGLSGAVCAKALNTMLDVTVFEQASMVGGRLRLTLKLSTTPFFTVSTPFFQQLVDRWEMEGLVKERAAWDVEISPDEINTLNISESSYIVKPNILSLFDHLLKGVPISCDTIVTEMERDEDNKWRLFDLSGQYLGVFDCVVFTSAAQPMHHLLARSSVLIQAAKQIEYSSIWTVTLTFNEKIDMPYDTALFMDPVLVNSYLLEPNVVCLIASPEWSEQNENRAKKDIKNRMTDAFYRLTGIKQQEPKAVDIKFWPYKTPVNTLKEDCVFDAEKGLAACGDWCTSPRVEGAVLSGFSVADRVMRHFSKIN